MAKEEGERFTVDHKQEGLVASKEKEQLQAEPDTTDDSYQTKDLKNSKLEGELKAKQKEMAFLIDQVEQHQKQLQQIADHKQRDLAMSKEKEQQLMAELDTAKRVSRAKDRQISSLEEAVQSIQVNMLQQNVLPRIDFAVQVDLTASKKEELSSEKLNTADARHAYEVSLAASKKKEQWLHAELSTTKHISRAKDQQIAVMQEELLARQVKMSPLVDQVEQQQNMLEIQQQKTFHLKSVEDTGVQVNYLAVAPGFLRGVEVCGETVLEVVGENSQKLEWPGYGFYIEVPDGALPAGVTASVAVKVILAGQFKLPENSQMISAIYWISSSEEFLKEVAVNIHHCAVVRSEEECSRFSFIIAKCSQKELPYRFRVREGAFNPYTQFGTIMLKRFSLVGATAPAGTETLYSALKFYSITSSVSVDFIFTIVRNLEPLLKYVKDQHRHWKSEVSQTVYFENSAITLDLPNSPPTVVDDWRIVPVTPPQITRTEVDYFKPKLEIPCCSLKLWWTGGDEVKPLMHRVTLKGAKSPKDYFYICYYPQAVGGSGQAGVRSGGESASSAAVPLALEAATTEGMTETSTELSKLETVDLITLTCLKYNKQGKEQRIYIVDELAPKWKRVGRMLTFGAADIDTIASSCHDDIECCDKLLSQWLQGHNDHNDSRSKTWKTLLEVMRDVRLGELADKLENILTS